MNLKKGNIGTRIRMALETKGLRPSDLATAIGVSRAAVSGWLRGEQLSVTNLVSIADYLEVSLNWLLLDLGSMNIAADARLSAVEEDLIKITRYFGSETIRPTLDMVKSLTSNQQNGIKKIKAYDLVSRTSMPIAVLDKDGHLVFSNIYHNRLLGLDEHGARKLIGKHFTDWIPKVFHRKFRTIIESTLKNGFADYSHMEITCPVTRKARPLIVHSRAIRIHDNTGVQIIIRQLDHDK